MNKKEEKLLEEVASQCRQLNKVSALAAANQSASLSTPWRPLYAESRIYNSLVMQSLVTSHDAII